MKYISTRNNAKEYSFEQVFIKGLADDGGLFIPKKVKKFSTEQLNALSNLSYQNLAKEIKGESVLLTFEPHPRKVLFDDDNIMLITSMKEKIKLLESFGLDHLIIYPFTKEFSKINPNFEMVAYVDPQPIGKDFAQKHNFFPKKAYSSLNEMLDQEKLDMLMIGSPNHLHLDHIKVGLKAGLQIFVEKPIVISEQETFELARENDYKIIGLTASGEIDVDSFESENDIDLDFYFCDETALKTIVRSNPAAIKLHEGTIIEKTHWNDFQALNLTNL